VRGRKQEEELSGRTAHTIGIKKRAEEGTGIMKRKRRRTGGAILARRRGDGCAPALSAR
jgi:hypothetical protein